MSEHYPRYISDYGHGEISLELPGIMDTTQAFVFAFPADAGAVQGLVDTFLNAPAQGAVQYSMLGDQVFTAFLHCAHLTSNVELMGWAVDHECGLWVPLLARGGGLDRIVVWMPYIFIDWQQGMITGREALGYRKSLGSVTIPLNPDDAASFVVQTDVFPTFSDATQEVRRTLLTLERAGKLGPLPSDWTELHAAYKAIHGVWTNDLGKLEAHRWEIAVDVAKLLFEMAIPIVNLKQFRAAHDTTRACYQAIIECSIGIRKFHAGGFIKEAYLLNIADVASHQVARDLGLAVPVKADFGLWLSLDMSADTGREVWKA